MKRITAATLMFVAASLSGAAGCGGARHGQSPVEDGRVTRVPPTGPSPGAAVAYSPPIGARPGCTPVAEAGGYELPDWVRRGRASAADEGPPPASTAEIAQRLAAFAPSDPAAADLHWALAKSQLRDADDSPDPSERQRARTEAIRSLARVVLLSPDHAESDTVLFTLGWALEELDQFDRARQVYLRLVRAHPSSRWIPHAYLSFGDDYFRQGDMSAAEQFYRKIIEFPPDANRVYGYALYRLASVLARLDQTRAARERFAELDRFLVETPAVPDREALRAAASADACGLP